MGLLYVRTLPGALKCVQLLFNLIAFICIAATGVSARGDAFLVASVGAFVITLLLLLIRIMDLDTKINLPWMKIEFGYCVIWSIFYLITAALVIDTNVDGYIAGGVFGLLAMILYIIDAIDKFRAGL
nr:uncharacterized protein LOC111413225 [Onthophagus taurus]